ncbi:dTDP-4-dehydrorhamnose 3,5-epimerase family protein [Pseudodesulfovibrio sp.]|uniref:dTDP-4-dehydrorhamnose 3,5-epimerase family protein n=1 Tax=Pseudodesulfovibrio sp. TaxID=2035812 RepID=UPI0026367B5A|nr:dTDP-4-dehydrorhamnose 3,5-epimerase family protein [Pseudodesulfovibrio sp.]MDD3312405.1 dTDP-4-dehydrorhamnose 3,5-epimerase family protein [Pseudodesulfovibrio sp.]
MRFEPLPLAGAHAIIPEPRGDERGWFGRFFCDEELRAVGLADPIRQINRSATRLGGTVRGLHFQRPPFAETKIVSCLRGAIHDVIVDIRRGSPTFLRWTARVLTGENREMLYVPAGFAHGFQALEDDVEIQYFVTRPYAPGHEGGLRFDDPALAIGWPLDVAVVSDKDRAHPLITDAFEGVEI